LASSNPLESLCYERRQARRVESQAKSAHFRLAVSDAPAEGSVTEEEVHPLNRLRRQLGVVDAAWTTGNIR
jgi:hypothetical protein